MSRLHSIGAEGRLGGTMSIAVRPRLLGARGLAATLAVGLVGVLVGLSVAPSKLPGDMLHVTPRSAAGGVVAMDLPTHAGPQLGLPDTSSVADVLWATVPVLAALVVNLTAFPVAVQSQPAATGQCRSVFGCRGPPALVAS